MNHQSTMRLIGATAGAALASLAGVAHADISDPGLIFTATNAQGTGSVSIAIAQGSPLPGGGWQWILGGPPIEILGPGNEVLGTINQSTATLDDTGGLVATSFALTSGTSDTRFTITSALVSFPTQIGTAARASAGLTVTDNTGNGATVTGNLAGGSVFGAHYNGTAPAGTNFANLISGPLVEASGFGSETTSQSFPAAPGVFGPIVQNVDSLSTLWDFTVTQDDQASGTSVFTLIPAPSSLALLGFASLAAVGRRRS